VAIITGGASGMGLATVRRFLAEGARVVLVARRRHTMQVDEPTDVHEDVDIPKCSPDLPSHR
jgi:NAD(P)-dependent dehydrogenase (short-subunit alcohol dehydrogenase family)